MKNILKKNKTLFILPLVLLPFVVLIFYILGGGEKQEKEAAEQQEANMEAGANYEIPHAERSIEIYDKLEAYQKQGQVKTETRDYHIMESGDTTRSKALNIDSVQRAEKQSYSNEKEEGSNDLMAHIRKKEQAVREELEQSGRKETSLNIKPGAQAGGSKTEKIKEARSKNTRGKNTSGRVSKPAYTGIEELDKVFKENRSLNQQNDSLAENLQKAQKQLLEIEQRKRASFILEKRGASGFGVTKNPSQLIKAEIYETATVLDGNRVKLRLLEDTWLEGTKIEKNSFVYGTCKTANERLLITISRIPQNESFIPVELSVLDLDGLAGLYVPDNAARKVSKEVGSGTSTSSLFGTTDNALSYIGLRTADRTAQTLLKRVRLKKVTVKKNTLVYLKNQNQ